ncbi:unnamed protein product [Cyclocybe aegerita]|uniref:Uncharacterized protein n=1 Tax=Cyclocybe aegerita TaxID=1973307 RepID=A0A8S0VU08_CYCAE|nr:unnamed protein product [Cyclocybe aegerita]
MQFNTVSTCSAFTNTSATAATHLYFGAAVDVDGFKNLQILAGPSHQPVTGIKSTKIPGLLSLMKPVESKAVVRIRESDQFPSPEDSDDERNIFVDGETDPSFRRPKRMHEEDSYNGILEVENSLLLSLNASVGTISPSVDSPAAKRPRLTSDEPTIDEREDQHNAGPHLGPDERMGDDESDSSSDMEAEAEDFSLIALTQGLLDDLVGFIEEAALYEAKRLPEKASMNQDPNLPPNVDPCPIHSFGTAAERPPVPAPRPIPQAPRRLQRSNERATINEDGSVEAFDYTQTNEYAERVAWERHIFVFHGRSGWATVGLPQVAVSFLRASVAFEVPS